jgi:hypothetical protein
MICPPTWPNYKSSDAHAHDSCDILENCNCFDWLCPWGRHYGTVHTSFRPTFWGMFTRCTVNCDHFLMNVHQVYYELWVHFQGTSKTIYCSNCSWFDRGIRGRAITQSPMLIQQRVMFWCWFDIHFGRLGTTHHETWASKLEPQSLPPTETCQVSIGSPTCVLMPRHPKAPKHVTFRELRFSPCACLWCSPMQSPSMPHDPSMTL